MATNTIDAALVQKMFLAGAKNLELKKEWINDLNVFPVPDGDTGTNMSMTFKAAVKEIENLDMYKLSKNYHKYNKARELHKKRNGYLQYQTYMDNYNLLELLVSLEADASLFNKSPQLYYIDTYNNYEYLKSYNRGRLEYMLGLYPKKYGPYNNLYNIKSTFNGDSTRFYHDFKDIITKYEIYDMFEKIN